jgi:hypothetical protein
MTASGHARPRLIGVKSFCHLLTEPHQLDTLTAQSWLVEGQMQFDQLKRREFFTLLGGGAVALPLAAGAQQATVPASRLYDGEWSGSATATIGPCKPALVTLTVTGRVGTGQVKFERDVANIGGTVREDGSFGATIGFRPLTGNFAGDMFEGTFDIFGCAWKMILNMKKP